MGSKKMSRRGSSKKAKSNKKGRSGNLAKNKIRGVVGATRDHSFSAAQNQKFLRTAARLRDVILEVRASVPPDRYDEYLAWLSAQLSSQVPALRDIPFTYRPPSGGGRSLSLPNEISWVASRLSREAETLCTFLAQVRKIERAFWGGDNEDVFARLDEIEQAHGANFWLVETRLGFEQLLHGLEAQKKYAEKVKSENPRTVLAYVAHYTSTRNEPPTSAQRFATDLKARLRQANATPDLKDYLQYRLGYDGTYTHNTLAAVLRAAQGYGVVDLYETFVFVLQELASSDLSGAERASIAASVEKLADVKDHRLERILTALRVNDQSAGEPETSAIQRLVQGQPKSAAVESFRNMTRGDPINILVAGYCCALMRPGVPLKSALPRGEVIDLVANVFAKGSGFERSRAELLKLGRNLRGLPSCDALYSFARLEGCYGGTVADMRNIWLNSESASVRLPSRGDSIVEWVCSDIRTHLPTPFAAAMAKHAQLSDADLRAQTLMPFLADRSSLVRTVVAIASIQDLTEAGRREEAVELAVQAFIENEAIRRALRIADILGNEPWDAVSGFTKKLCAPIALDLLWRETEDDQVATYRRFAVSEFIAANGVERPSELKTATDSIPKNQLIYFLRRLCVPTVLDMMMIFESSQEIEDERSAICSVLLSLDPQNAQEYRDEILNMEHRKMLQEGMRLLDQSRIHVDIDGVKRIAERELREGFDRYVQLVTAGVGVAEDFDVILREVRTEKKYLELPENEADDLLVAMIKKLCDIFMLNTSYGLDSYLSKRIRHGSMPGYLRSPVEQARLITQRVSVGGHYQDNDYWLSRLSDLDGARLMQASRHFKKFSEEFDGIVLSLKDDILQVRNDDHPKGVFSITLSPPAYYLIRSAVQDDLRFEGFLAICISVFWALLEASLGAARLHLDKKTKNELSQAFGRLRAGLLDSAGSDRSFPELSTQIGNASAAVQAEVDRVAEWIQRPEVEQSTKTYTLVEAVDIAIASAVNAHKAHTLRIDKVVLSDVSLFAGDLVILADVLRVALGNVCLHSKLAHPNVRIEVAAQSDVLAFKIVSDLAPEVATPEAIARLQGIREEIAQGSYDSRLRGEGGTGLVKLASLTAQSSRGRLEFDFVSESQFKLEVDLSFLVPS